MSAHFTLGIEEEFQIVDRRTGQLTPSILAILEKGASQFGDKIKPEMLQSTVEIVTDICPNINAARLELQSLHTRLLRLLEEEGLTIISAGTHPTASWPDQPSTPDERYIELEEELQDVVRSLLIFGLHVHVGVESNEIAIVLMNQLRTWIPHLLALSANSPFWGGRFTGLKSYRSVMWRPLPRNGVSEPFASWDEFDSYVQSLVQAGCIDNAKKIWWDIRPHPFFRTVEFRICDMPATVDDTGVLCVMVWTRRSLTSYKITASACAMLLESCWTLWMMSWMTWAVAARSTTCASCSMTPGGPEQTARWPPIEKPAVCKPLLSI